MKDPLALCLTGALSPEVALARLVLAGQSPDEIAARVAALPRGERATHLRELAARQDALGRVRDMLAVSGLDHAAANAAPADAVARIAGLFDRAVACAPLASVAAYSLDDPAILDAATAELVAWLGTEGMLGGDVLDLGCGIGRVAATIAPYVRSVLGTDASPAMVAEARRRHAGVENARFEHTAGLGIDTPPASLDLVLAVDSFPYLVQAGAVVADRHLSDAALAIRPGGCIALLNLSYRADPALDAADARRWAAQHGLALGHAGIRPFTLWDGAAWVLRRAHPISPSSSPAR